MPLSAHEREVIDTLLPAEAHPLLPHGAIDVGFEDFVGEFLRSATPFIRTAVRLALLAATWLAPLLVGKLPPLGRLTRGDRERALEAMLASRLGLLRQLVVLLKLVVAISYGADAGVREAIGYARERTS